MEKAGRKVSGMIAALCMAIGLSAALFGTEEVRAEENGAFGDFGYEVLDDGTVKIADYRGLDTVVNVPEEINGRRVAQIGYAAFEDCKNIVKIDIPNGVTCIERQAFSGCEKLTEIHLPSGVTDMGDFVFSGCGSLTNIDLPSELTQIESGTFYNCDHLERVRFPDQLEKLAIDVFFNCSQLKEISISGDNLSFASMDGILYNKDFSTIVCYPMGKNDPVTFLPSVNQIGDGAFRGCGFQQMEIPSQIKSIGSNAFSHCKNLSSIKLPMGITKIESSTFSYCSSLTNMEIPKSVTYIGLWAFNECGNLTSVFIPDCVSVIQYAAFYMCGHLKDVYYAGNEEQWKNIDLNNKEDMNEALLKASIHFEASPIPDPGPEPDPTPDPEPEPDPDPIPEPDPTPDPDPIPEPDPKPTPPEPTDPDEPGLSVTINAKEELERLKSGDSLSIASDFKHYLSSEQIDLMESCLYTWLADINYAYRYSESSGIQERIRKKSGIDPQVDAASGRQQAITHITAETKYGKKTFEIKLDLGKPDGGGNLYPSYGTMHYEVFPKGGIPSDVPVTGQIGRSSYADMASFVESVAAAADNSLHSTHLWPSLSDEMASGILIDKTAAEIIGNKNGSFCEGIFTIYARPLVAYSKKVTIACPVDVYVYRMDGKYAGTIINNEPNAKDENVLLEVNGDTKTVYLTGNDYYLSLRGTDTGTMKYEVEEIANKEVCRNVQFLELQLKKDMQYEGYVFRPLNIDSDLYALRTIGGSASGDVTYTDKDSNASVFKKIQGMSLSQHSTSLGKDKTIQLKVSLFPQDAANPKLVWSSDNPFVAFVDDNGLVTAVAPGRAMITAATCDGSFLKQSCIIDVERSSQPDVNVPAQPETPPLLPVIPTPPETPPDKPNEPAQPPGQPQDPVKDENLVVAKLYYIVQFYANGGTNLSRRTMTLLNNDILGILPKVQRKAYLFDGWYTQQTGGIRITGDQTLPEATTLYAHWTKARAPARAALQTVVSKKKGEVKVGFKKISGAAGYQVQYAPNKKFTSAKTVGAGASAKTKTLTGLKAGKKYYVRVRAYQVDSLGNKIFGSYSAPKRVLVKG